MKKLLLALLAIPMISAVSNSIQACQSDLYKGQYDSSVYNDEKVEPMMVHESPAADTSASKEVADKPASEKAITKEVAPKAATKEITPVVEDLMVEEITMPKKEEAISDKLEDKKIVEDKNENDADVTEDIDAELRALIESLTSGETKDAAKADLK